jgi:hypothetical protein
VYWPFDLGKSTGLTLGVLAVVVAFLVNLRVLSRKRTEESG